MRQQHLSAILILLTFLLLAMSPSAAQAGGGVSVCDETSLRAALAGGGAVTFSCSGTITLTNPIAIGVNTTIDGSGQAVTLSGNDAVRVFTVNSGVTLSLKNVTIADGKDETALGAGGVRSAGGTVIVANSTFFANTAYVGGGISVSNGTLSVSNSRFISNTAYLQTGLGGGIYIDRSQATVSNSTFYGNGAFQGGGIDNSGGTLTVANSSFTANDAESAGGGIASTGMALVSASTFSGNTCTSNESNCRGGGIVTGSATGQMTVTNSTFADNSADIGDAIANTTGGKLTVTNSTLSGGGISNLIGTSTGTATLQNTIGGSCAGPITDGGGNLSSDTTCPGTQGDPKLGPLQDNGGPTLTMALDATSPAIDAGNAATCQLPQLNGRDQRGLSRFADGDGDTQAECDIGAYEYGAQPLPAPAPAVAISKQPPYQMVASGGQSNFTIVVTNTGGATLTSIVVADPLTPDCAKPLPDLLPATATSYTCSGTAPADFVNVAVVSALPLETAPAPAVRAVQAANPVTATAVAAVDVVTPGLTLVKTATTNPLTCGTPGPLEIVRGTPVYFCVAVSNTGDITLTDHIVSDPLLGLTNVPVPYLLAPGASLVITPATLVPFGGPPLGPLTPAESITNTVVVTASLPVPAGGPIVATAASLVPVTVIPPAALDEEVEPNTLLSPRLYLPAIVH